MKTISSYQKLKLKIKELEKDIYNLVKNENEPEGITTKIHWNIIFDLDDMTMFGDGSKNECQGIIQHAKNVKYRL